MSIEIESTFRERPDHLHVRLREALLHRGRGLLGSPAINVRARAADFPDAGGEALLTQIGAYGLGVAQLDRPLANDRLMAFGSLLGTAIPETDPAVQPYVEQQVVLNLVTEYQLTVDVNLQPFAANSLTLHSESSGRSVTEQPRYVVLLCHEPGAAGAAQTVLVPMAEVARRLTADQRAVLARTRYRRARPDSPILRQVDGRPVFSFRDFGSQPLDWACASAECRAEQVDAAIAGLLAAMYAPGIATGVQWARGMLVVIDNSCFFHGRTIGMAAAPGRRRHLKRLRVR